MFAIFLRLAGLPIAAQQEKASDRSAEKKSCGNSDNDDQTCVFVTVQKKVHLAQASDRAAMGRTAKEGILRSPGLFELLSVDFWNADLLDLTEICIANLQQAMLQESCLRSEVRI